MVRKGPLGGCLLAVCLSAGLAFGVPAAAQEHKHSSKPPLRGRHWVAVTGKPLGAAAGALIFSRGGNAVDAACGMLAAAATIGDAMGWGGETQALIYDPGTGRVHAINALGVAPTDATPDRFRQLGRTRPPDFGPLAAITPGTPGGLLVMLSEFGTMSLAEVLGPALELADGYPIDRIQVDTLEGHKHIIRRWEDSRRTFLPHDDPDRPDRHAAPHPGEVFRQPDLLATLGKLVAAEREALAAGRSRQEAIMAAYDRFYRGDIARELTRSVQEAGGLIRLEDLARWQVRIERPVRTTYREIEVCTPGCWVQGPVLLQMLNILETFDLAGMGYNSSATIHTLCQTMNLAFADRDFYYGDPRVPPAEPLAGLLSKAYARQRAALIRPDRIDLRAGPGDPYPFQQETNPFSDLLRDWRPQLEEPAPPREDTGTLSHDRAVRMGTTSIQAADAEGWLVSIAPSGGWVPAFVAGRTGIGLSQRMQSFAFDPARSPFNVLEPGKQPRATPSPAIALRAGRPLMAVASQGGDLQEQSMLQYILNVVEFGMDPQQAAEAASVNSYQLHSSFGPPLSKPGRIQLRRDVLPATRERLRALGYTIEQAELTSGPVTAIVVDQAHGTMTGAASDFGHDYGIAW